jgi:hypothetical protein
MRTSPNPDSLSHPPRKAAPPRAAERADGRVVNASGAPRNFRRGDNYELDDCPLTWL